MKNFWCEFRSENNSCELCNKKGDVQSDEQKLICPNSEIYIKGKFIKKHFLKLLGSVVTVIQAKHKNGRSKKESTERNLNHFKKEIFPGLPAFEKKHFSKKHSIKYK